MSYRFHHWTSNTDCVNSEANTIHVLANEIVPGDLVKFSTGDRIPADIRIIDSVDLEIDESSLTGETEARKKFSTTCPFEGGASVGEPVALAERTCIAYMGTLVRNGKITCFSLDSGVENLKISGRATGIVIATGTETEFGVIFSMMQDVRSMYPPSVL